MKFSAIILLYNLTMHSVQPKIRSHEITTP